MRRKNRTPLHRHAAIERQLLMDGTASVEFLAQIFGVSVATIRRDLTMLEKDGSILRTHGGAVVSQQRRADQEFALREQVDSDAKRFIARAALEFIKGGQTLFMNDGSTMLALAHELAASDITLTVVTNGVNIATALSENPRIVTYLAGGLLRHRTLGTTGDFTEQMLAAINADTALIATEGFSIKEGLTHSYEVDAKIARLMQARATKSIVLTTTRKLNQCDPIRGLPASAIDVMVTDCEEEHTIGPIRDMGIFVVVAKGAELDGDNTQILPL